jgi:LmbE family N-acetylglucosaminyl deacetylase
MKQISKKTTNYDLIVVAHPDDETIFFGGLLQTKRPRPVKIVCVTDGNADGLKKKRFAQFAAATARLGVKDVAYFNLPDIYDQRLSQEVLISLLRSLARPERIFTHGIIGEYGHPHHQDVSHAVHLAFQGHRQHYSVAYNCFAELLVSLSSKTYAKKCQILSEIYGSETIRFNRFLPATFVEGFVRVKTAEVIALYNFLTSGKAPHPSDLRVYKWYWSYLKTQSQGAIPARPF